MQILQINFKFSIARTDFEDTFTGVALIIANIPGLHWQIWTIDESEQKAEWICMFDNKSSVDAYLGKLMDGLDGNPSISDICVKRSQVLNKLTKITRGFDGCQQIQSDI